MTERIGLEGVFDITNFNSGLSAYVAGIGRATGITQLASAGFNALGEIVTGAFRRIGSIVTNDLVRFSEQLLQSAIAGSTLESAMASLNAGLSETTKLTLQPLFNQLGDLVAKASPSILGFVNFAETQFEQLGSSALVYGQNIVSQLAQGMFNAIGQVLDALTSIGNMITYFLAPGSPPRLLPDLDTWGTDAANQFLGGWSKADFGVFNDLSSTLTSLIRSLPIPAGDQINIVPRIIGAKSGIAEAVEELRTAGSVSTATMDSIIKSVGTADSSVRAYLDSMIQLQAANQSVQSAQDNLNAVTAQYADLLKPINDQLAGIDEAQQQLVDNQQRSLLQRVLKDPNATANEKSRAQLQLDKIDAAARQRLLVAEQKTAVDTAQTKLDAAKNAQSQAQDEFDAKKALIQFQTDENGLLKEQLALLTQLAKAGGGGAAPKAPAAGKGAGVVIPFKPDFSALDGLEALIGPKLDALKTMFGNVLDAIALKFQPTIDAINQRLIPSVQGLLKAFQDSLPKIEAVIADLVAFAVVQFGAVMPSVINNLADSIDTLTLFWQRHGDTVLAILDFLGRAIIVTLSGSLLVASALIDIALRSIEAIFDTVSAAIQGNWDLVWRTIASTVAINVLQVLSTIDTILHQVASIVDLDLDTIRASWAGTWELINIAVDKALTDLSTGITTWLATTSAAINTSLTGMATTITGWITTVQTDWDKFWAGIQKTITSIDWGAIGKGVIDGISAGISGAIAGLASTAAGAAAAALAAAKAALGIHSPSTLAANLVGKPFSQGIAKGILDSVSTIQAAARLAASSALANAGGRTPGGQSSSSSTVSSPSTIYVPGAGSRAQTFVYSPTYTTPPAPVTDNFGVMQAFYG